MKKDNIILLYIGTARIEQELTGENRKAWEYKKRFAELEEDEMMGNYEKSASVFAEFSRIRTITTGQIKDGRLHLKNYAFEDEKKLLEIFFNDIRILQKKNIEMQIAGYNTKGFDVPFIFKRAIVNQVKPHKLFNIGGLKPWEVGNLDIWEQWNGTSQYKGNLIGICNALGVESPRNDKYGAEVDQSFYDVGISEVLEHTQNAITSIANVFMRLMFEPLISKVEISEVEEPKPLGLIERIGEFGITEADKKELVKKASELDYVEKEKLIEILKGVLLPIGGELEQEVELLILGA